MKKTEWERGRDRESDPIWPNLQFHLNEFVVIATCFRLWVGRIRHQINIQFYNSITICQSLFPYPTVLWHGYHFPSHSLIVPFCIGLGSIFGLGFWFLLPPHSEMSLYALSFRAVQIIFDCRWKGLINALHLYESVKKVADNSSPYYTILCYAIVALSHRHSFLLFNGDKLSIEGDKIKTEWIKREHREREREKNLQPKQSVNTIKKNVNFFQAENTLFSYQQKESGVKLVCPAPAPASACIFTYRKLAISKNQWGLAYLHLAIPLMVDIDNQDAEAEETWNRPTDHTDSERVNWWDLSKIEAIETKEWYIKYMHTYTRSHPNGLNGMIQDHMHVRMDDRCMVKYIFIVMVRLM